MSDVVKGTAKPKSTNAKDKDNGVACNSPRAASPASPVPKPAAVPEVKAQQQQLQQQQQTPPPPPPQQQLQTSHQVPLPVQAQILPPSCEKEVKDVGTSSDSNLHAVLQTPPSSPDK